MEIIWNLIALPTHYDFEETLNLMFSKCVLYILLLFSPGMPVPTVIEIAATVSKKPHFGVCDKKKERNFKQIQFISKLFHKTNFEHN